MAADVQALLERAKEARVARRFREARDVYEHVLSLEGVGLFDVERARMGLEYVRPRAAEQEAAEEAARAQRAEVEAVVEFDDAVRRAQGARQAGEFELALVMNERALELAGDDRERVRALVSRAATLRARIDRVTRPRSFRTHWRSIRTPPQTRLRLRRWSRRSATSGSTRTR